MAALRARGLNVQPFKVGPDFIDPSHHTVVCGRPSRNLDPFMMDEEGVRRSFCTAMQGADVAVVEGVMGLFDGMDGTEVSSSAQVAKILDIPVLLVINVTACRAALPPWRRALRSMIRACAWPARFSTEWEASGTWLC